MKILFDHQIFEYQKFGGISRYFFELLHCFQENKIAEWELPIQYSNNEYLLHLQGIGQISPIPVERDPYTDFLFGYNFKGKDKIYRIANLIAPLKPPVNFSQANKDLVIEKLKKGDFDVFHPTYYDSYFIDFIGNKPFVITVYDLIHEIFPEYSLGDVNIKSDVLFKRANKIIAISESTKKDLINVLGINENKIVVNHLASSLGTFVSLEPNKLLNIIPTKFLLFVGNRTIYKNFYFFAQLFAAISKDYNDLYLVCTGKDFDAEEIGFLERIGIKEKVRHFYVNDNELSYLYKNAFAFVFPSLYEGFGIPILEAFSFGCPVLASASSSITEVGGDAVLYFNPKNAESMVDALKLILEDENYRNDLISKGYNQLSKFSWLKTTEATLAIYNDII